MITDKVGGSSAKPEVSKQSKEKRPKHKVSGYKSQSKRWSIAGCRLLLRTLVIQSKSTYCHLLLDWTENDCLGFCPIRLWTDSQKRTLTLKLCIDKRFQLYSDKHIYNISKLTIIFGIVKIYWWFRIEFKKSQCKIYNIAGS